MWNARMPMRGAARRMPGITLIELLVALAIVAILAGLAYPSYIEHMQRGRRLDAINTLLAMRVAQEQWRGQHRQYADLNELGWADAVSNDGHYQLQISTRDAAGFVAEAIPRRDGPQADDACGVFAIDQRGPLFDAAYAQAECWRR